jgi:protein-L-isoaspartate(D-aspartate) O-methyltransferase
LAIISFYQAIALYVALLFTWIYNQGEIMAETSGQQPMETDTTSRVVDAAGFLVRTSTELQRWSSHLDWSKRLVAEGVLTTPELVEAFSKVKRIDFLPPQQKPDTGYDHPIQIGHRQTNSQPSLVAQMLELLKLKEGQAVLDIGAGSGWTTGLVASTVGDGGRVVGTERIEELVDFGKDNLSRYGFSWARVEHTDSGDLGFAPDAPYDRILVSAHMLEEWMPELTAQLSPDGGIMVAPIATPDNHGSRDFNQDIVVVTKNGDEISSTAAYKEVGFVPLIRDKVEV